MSNDNFNKSGLQINFKNAYHIKSMQTIRNLIPLIYNILENSNFYLRKSVLVGFDQLIIVISLMIGILLEGIDIKNPIILFINYYYIFCFALFIYLFTGQYKVLTKYSYSSSIYKIGLRNILIGLLAYIFNSLGIVSNNLNLNVIVIFILINTIFSFLLRSSLSWLIKNIQDKKIGSNNVIIYGAGAAGAQLASIFKMENSYNIISFIDDDKSLWGRTIYSIQIRSPRYLHKTNQKIDKILLAMPSINLSRRQLILKKLSKFDIPVYQIPLIQELISGKEKIDTLRPITIEELLGREPVLPLKELISKGINKKSICITGAGGSIGSELSKQILEFSPAKLVLVDNSESNLYLIGIELRKNTDLGCPIVFKLGDCTNEKFIDLIFKEYEIDMVFHAAAYKHVPIVEENPLPGISNNVISTLTICEASLKNNLEKMILISSDKAVRPTNVMGASKRLAEQIVLDFAKKNKSTLKDRRFSSETCFSLVRFGNVLGSSGSVIPLFKKQIKEGGPITITDKKIIRYFMTLQEAAQLVLHVAGISEGGGVFLLDMGKPVSIQYLAEQMIKLSGSSIKKNPSDTKGIEIKYTGLRPGEKLFEELLIDSNAQKTSHPLIFKGVNEDSSCHDLLNQIKLLNNKIINFEEKEALKILANLVPDWNHNRIFDTSNSYNRG